MIVGKKKGDPESVENLGNTKVSGVGKNSYRKPYKPLGKLAFENHGIYNHSKYVHHSEMIFTEMILPK